MVPVARACCRLTLVREKRPRLTDEYSKLELTAKAKVSETILKVGSLAFRTPVVSSNDTRLLPATFEGALLTSKDIDKLMLQGGKLEQIKFNSSSNYQDFTGNRIGGVSDDFRFAGGTYSFNKALSTSLYYGNLENVYRQYFGGVVYEIPTRPNLTIAEVRPPLFEKHRRRRQLPPPR